MKPPSGEWLELDEVESTQDVAALLVKVGKPTGVVFAHHQSSGRGRFGRTWVSEPGSSLTMSLIFSDYVDHPRPWLIGMAVACACAGVLHCQLRWPNDLVVDGKKLGGILTELLPDEEGRLTPVVGVGVNLKQHAFAPEIASFATSLAGTWHEVPDAKVIAERIIARLADMPEPSSWRSLQPIWALFDATPGKIYKLTDGKEGVAIGVGPEGELLCAVDGESTTVMAAEAIFG